MTADQTAALIVAAGRGTRAGPWKIPKQFQSIGGRSVLSHTLDAFLSHPKIGKIQLVIGSGDAAQYNLIAPHMEHVLPPVVGGRTRQESVLAGLKALAPHSPRHVLIHDAARPFVDVELITVVVDALELFEAVVPTLPVSSTLKIVDAGGEVTATLPRDRLHAAETPQGFRFDTILDAHRKAAAEGRDFTDDAAVAEWAGIAVRTVPGDPANIKLTTAADIVAANRRLAMDAALRLGDVRVGNGYDIHAFGPGNEVMLGGVAIPHARGLVGHSDADVALHALTDALLGALAEGDIGAHFPPNDPQWRGASSDRFLADAASRVAVRGGVIAHLDLTIVAESPRVGPHRDAMRQRIAGICGIAIDRVAVKATTNEGLGFIGRGEGIAAYATATIRLPLGVAP
jgi:2-C-methyl-D-erythritol 4-phosphate cytidylyltransferase / 2-C-methyl-D-erythritol 2,4-cyclodiphosphate synthase